MKKKQKVQREISVEVKVVSLEKTIIQRAFEYSLKKGYTVLLDGGILLFPYSDNNNIVIKDLISRFGYERKEEISGEFKTVKRLPLSYGFTDPKRFAGKIEISGVEKEDEENEDAET